MTPPDCPHCSATATLAADWIPRYALLRAFCSCCAKITWLSPDGAVVAAPEPVQVTHDGSGNYLPKDP